MLFLASNLCIELNKKNHNGNNNRLSSTGPAEETLLQLAKEKQRFDVVFIDSDKDGYKNCYQVVKLTTSLFNVLVKISNILNISNMPILFVEKM